MPMSIQVGDVVNVTVGKATLDKQEVKSIPGNNEIYWELEDSITGAITVVGPTITTIVKVA